MLRLLPVLATSVALVAMPAQPPVVVPAESASPSAEPQRRLQQARDALARAAGDAAEVERLRARARDDLLWCFDRGARADRAFAPTRLGEVLDLLGELASRDAATKQALLLRRDRCADAITRGGLDNNQVADLLALDEVLHDGEHAALLYERLTTRFDRELLAFFYGGVRPDLWRARRYALLLDGRPDAVGRVEAAASALREAQKRLGTGKLQPAVGFVPGVVFDAGIDFEARVGQSRYDAAEQLAKVILALSPGERTLARLVAHAQRAEREAFAKRFAADALGSESSEAVLAFWRVVAEERDAIAQAVGMPEKPADRR